MQSLLLHAAELLLALIIRQIERWLDNHVLSGNPHDIESLNAVADAVNTARKARTQLRTARARTRVRA